MSLRSKLILSQTLIILVAAGLVAFFAFQRRSAEIFEDFQELVRRTAGTVALNIKGDDLAAIKTNEDEATPEFQRIEDLLNRARKVIGISEKEIYIMRPVEGLFDLEFVVMAEKPRYIGNRYLITAANETAFQAAFDTGLPQFTQQYVDEHGTWISGYGPIQDSTGAVVAILEVDTEVGRFLARKNAEMWTLAALAGGLTLLGGILVAAFTSPLVSVVRKLMDAFKQIGEGQFPNIDSVKRRDEMGRLVEGFNAMSYNLHLSQYQLQEAVKSLNSVAEKAPAMFLSKDRRLVVLLVLEQIAARESLKDAELLCAYRADEGAADEKQVTLNAWQPGTANATHTESLPLHINDKSYGTITIRCSESFFPVDMQIARIWAHFLAAILAAKDIADAVGREAKSEAMDVATGRFLNEIEEIEKNLKVDGSAQAAPGSSDATAPNIRRAAKRIELVKRDLSMIAKAESGTESRRPIGSLLNETVREFQSRYPEGMHLECQDLTTSSDSAPDSKKLQAVLLTLLAFCERAQRSNPQSHPAAAELTAKTIESGLRISIQSNMPSLTADEMEKILRTGSGTEAFDDTLLPMPMAKLVIESVGGSIDYQPGVGHGGLFLLRVPLLKVA